MADPNLRDPTTLETAIRQSKTLKPGNEESYRAYVGPPEQYDFMGATQFRLLTGLGLREEHRLLDIGCGSLRAGRFFIHYLLPGRYIGIEPNDWLWRHALEEEIGEDILHLRKPLFLRDPNFTVDTIGGKVDFIVAQSIYSHTGANLLGRSVKAAALCLAPRGQFLFTAITPGRPGPEKMRRGYDAPGWNYPQCVTYSDSEIEAFCCKARLKVQRLPWFHPRQTWYRATLDAPPLDDDMLVSLGAGRPLFDERFDAAN